jgi:hypothetical protein
MIFGKLPVQKTLLTCKPLFRSTFLVDSRKRTHGARSDAWKREDRASCWFTIG